jgi:hypothetical protein
MKPLIALASVLALSGIAATAQSAQQSGPPASLPAEAAQAAEPEVKVEVEETIVAPGEAGLVEELNELAEEEAEIDAAQAQAGAEGDEKKDKKVKERLEVVKKRRTEILKQIEGEMPDIADVKAFARFYDGSPIATGGTRVDVDFDNTPVKEAFRRVIEQGKYEPILDDDVPGDARVTLRAKNVRLSSVLNVLADVAGVNWRQEIRNEKKSIHIGKKVTSGVSSFIWRTPPGAQGGKFVVPGAPNHLFPGGQGGNRLIVPTPGAPGKGGTFTLPRTPGFQGLGQGFSGFQGLGQNYVVSPLIGQRTTFSCPHCKGKTTMIRVRQQPQCPKCSRTFEADWQYCPADGTKRPSSPTSWQYCPLCGKRVEVEKSDAGDELQPAGQPCGVALGSHPHMHL